MTKGSDSREFFELFKPPPKVQDTQKDEIKSQTETPEISPQYKLPISEETSVSKPMPTADPLGWIKKTTAENPLVKEKPRESPLISAPSKNERGLRKDEVVLRQETLIIGAIAATFLSIACFFIGHKVGYNKGITSHTEEWLETIEPQDTKKTTFGPTEPEEVPPQKAASKSEKQIEQQKPIIKDKWTLRVISYKNTKDNVEKAKETAKTIQNTLGYDTFIVNTGKEIFICVGEFETNNNADLINAQKTLAEFKYENRKQFEGCYPIRMR
ncbi:MAG: hypothetical protein E3K36_05760 [Candidatus Brocadia sp.]|nr:hypothetical protein [Candidatus Brocadia sp.]